MFIDIILLQPETQLFELGRDRANLCNHICELLSFAVKNHTYRSKYYILGSKIIEKMCLLLKCKETYVRLCKFFWSSIWLFFQSHFSLPRTLL